MIPATDKIKATFSTPYIRSAFVRGDMFDAALRTIEEGLAEGKIYNQEFIAAKDWIARGCEHAQHISSDGAREESFRNLPGGDVRHDIGYAFQMNQAAKASRNLKKLSPEDFTPGIAEYVATLDQIDGLWKWLQSVKPIIVKGRKPNPNPKPVDTTNMGTCAICEEAHKLERSASRHVVHHGYTISDGYGHYFGHRAGKCPGTGFPPYELSNAANKAYKKFLEGELKNAESYLADLKESKPDTLSVLEHKRGLSNPVRTDYPRGTAQYERERERRVSETEGEIRWLKDAIPYQQVRIDTWRLQPLAD